MRAVILGGTGFIGSRLVQKLVQKNHDVAVVTRSPDKQGGRLPDGVSAIGYGELASTLDGADAVINLAGASIAEKWTPEHKKRIVDSRVQSCRTLADAIRETASQPKVWIQGSAVGYYGDTKQAVVDESAPAGQGFLAETALKWEAAAREGEEMGVRLVWVRTGVVLGRGGGLMEKFLPPFKFFVGGPLGHGKQGVSWVHMDDETGAILHLMENESASGPYNLTAPEPVNMDQFCRTLGKVLARPSWLRAPSFALRLALGEMAKEMILAGQFATPKRLLESGYSFVYPTLAAALENLTE